MTGPTMLPFPEAKERRAMREERKTLSPGARIAYDNQWASNGKGGSLPLGLILQAFEKDDE